MFDCLTSWSHSVSPARKCRREKHSSAVAILCVEGRDRSRCLNAVRSPQPFRFDSGGPIHDLNCTAPTDLHITTWATTRSAAPPPPPRFIKTSEHSTYLRFLVIKRNSKGGLSLAIAGVLTSRTALAPHDGIRFRLNSTSTVLCLAQFLS